MNESVKNTFNFLKSMKFGLILLAHLCILAIIGSIIPQGREEAFYLSNYSPLWAQVIISFELFDIYHSGVFVLLFISLSINLFLCSTIRLKKTIHKIKNFDLMPDKQKLKNPVSTEKYSSNVEIRDIFLSHGFKNIRCKSDDSEEIYYSSKNKIGYLGSWLIHIGILAIIVCYGYGQYTFWSGAIYGVSGSIQELEGTDYIMNIEDFNIVYREDASIEQYITQGTLTDQDGSYLISDEIYVNNPMRYKGYTFYQHSTGWASEINISKNDEVIDSEVLYDGTAYVNDKEFIIIQMNHVYPDFIRTESGFASKSNQLNNPKVLYSILYGGQRVDMNIVSPGEDIHWQNFTFSFDTPKPYTYLSVNKMNGKIGAIISSIILMVGLVLAFYIKPKQLIVKRKNDNIYIYGDSSVNSKIKFKPSYQSNTDISI